MKLKTVKISVQRLMIVLTVGILAFVAWQAYLPDHSLGVQNPEKPDTNVNTARELPPTVPSASSAVAFPSKFTESPVLSPSSKLKALLKEGSPSSHFQAYKMVKLCLTAKAMEVDAKQHPDNFLIKPPSPEVACGDLDAGQLSSGLNYLRIAAAAGERGSVENFLMEGPDGLGTPTDTGVGNPVLLEWWGEVSRYIKVGAEKGDVYSLQSLALHYENDARERDFKTSLTYWMVANQMQQEATGRPLKSFASTSMKLSSLLSPPELAEVEKAKNLLLDKISIGRKK
jgi:hypothetical protein